MQGSQFLCVPSALCWWRWKVLGEHGMEVVPPPALLIQQERNPASTREEFVRSPGQGWRTGPYRNIWRCPLHLLCQAPCPSPRCCRIQIPPQSGAAATWFSPHSPPGNREIREKCKKKPSSRPENPPVNPSGHCHLPTGPSILQDHGSAHTEHGASEAF